MNSHLFLNTKMLHLILSIVIGIIFWQLMVFLGAVSEGTVIYPVFRVFGGEGFTTFVKLLAYIAFAYAMLDLLEKKRNLHREEGGFALGLLPEQDQLVLSEDDVANIKLAVIQHEQRGIRLLVPALIKKAATQYRNDKSVSDTLQVLEAQFHTAKDEQEGLLETTRYIIQTIPMLGFIGTIVELTAALQLLDEGIDAVRQAMYQAFDATLVALSLTIILTMDYHSFLGKLDVFFARMKSYMLDNLISRIYRP